MRKQFLVVLWWLPRVKCDDKHCVISHLVTEKYDTHSLSIHTLLKAYRSHGADIYVQRSFSSFLAHIFQIESDVTQVLFKNFFYQF